MNVSVGTLRGGCRAHRVAPQSWRRVLDVPPATGGASLDQTRRVWAMPALGSGTGQSNRT